MTPQRLLEVVSVKFVLKKAFSVGLALLSTALSVLSWLWDSVRGLMGSSPKADAMRAARSAALS